MFSWLLKPLAAVGVFLLAIGAAFLKGRSEGRYGERVKQWEKANEAGEKMDAVPDSSSDDTVDSLRDDKF